ncbi:putative membrane protein [Pseudomonas syringae pv. cerasicola]|nr:putative membrane protein [Pseudomonas syringae pv. cerasicola]
MLIGSAIALVVVLHFTTRLSSIMLFWIAFVLTRPFGATLGDVLTKPYEKGGLDFGTIGSSAVLLAVLLVLVLVVVVVVVVVVATYRERKPSPADNRLIESGPGQA